MVATTMTAGDGAARVFRAALVIIGNEILSGRTQDKNLAYVATALNGVGVRLAEVRVIPDIEAEIVATVNELRAKFDYVFTTGGIGPTHDDITAGSIARAFGLPLVRHPEALARLQAHYHQTGRELNEMRLRMANTPEGAALIDNPVSAAPGFRVQNVYVMAGVPQIMQAMIDTVKNTLAGGSPVLARSLTARLGEGNLAAGLQDIQAQWPEVDIGSYPFYRHGDFGTTIVLRHTDPGQLEAAGNAVAALMRAHGADPVEGEPQ